MYYDVCAAVKLNFNTLSTTRGNKYKLQKSASYYYYYVLLRHNGSKTYSPVHTHTVIHANTSTKNTKRFLKTVKNGKKEQNW